MKRLFPLVLMLLFSLVCNTCTKNEIEVEKEISLLRTQLGGCHNENYSDLKSVLDTVPYYVGSSVFLDTLDIAVGLNYLCCTPFSAQVAISHDSIFIDIDDTCDYPEETCYCKCMCYYTWDFYFVDFEGKAYTYMIVLNSPLEEDPIIVGEGSFLIGD